MTASEIAERIQEAIDGSPYADGMIRINLQEHDWIVILSALRQGAANSEETK